MTRSRNSRSKDTPSGTRPSRSPRRTQAERTALSDARILEAAITLIARQGFSKTTLSQIGKQAGYTGGLVSHRFGSKQGLLQALIERVTGRFVVDQVLPAVAESGGVEAVCAMVDAYFTELRIRDERVRALYVLMGEALGPVPEVRDVFAELNREFRDGVAEWISRGIEVGEISGELDPGTEAAMVVAMLRGIAMQWLTEPGSIDLDAARRSVAGALRARLLAHT